MNTTAPNPDPATAPEQPLYPPYRRWVHVLALLLVAATFVLIAIGGHVTSKDAGMAVPDGFTTFGVWSLIAPLETWWYDEGTRLEHSHRLKGYVVGSLTIAVLVAVMFTQRRRRWVKGLAWGLLAFVILQGIMGILRVDEVSIFLAGIHGVTGQIFFCLTVLMATAVSRFWMSRPTDSDEERHRRTLRIAPLLLLAGLLVQLMLGSAVRHSQSALAIPDWPFHYGQVMPPMSQPDIDAAVAAVPDDERAERFAPLRVDAETGEVLPGTYETWQVHLHFTHRLGAYALFIIGIGFAAWVWRSYPGQMAVLLPATLFAIFLLLQVGLGVMTVLSGEHYTLATSHQSVGAILFATATWMTVRLHLVPPASSRPANIPVAAGDATTEIFRKSSPNLDADPALTRDQAPSPAQDPQPQTVHA
ncbi:COX15/CtaA family protein [Algisphaera agarilytica]|uniref:Cytochrome c oxidase assembly protein subunit 15 n=1 Tax=Algisphaera agarilytica TaxID=1385975 RepID=A0A7X0HAL8_9BACT|nr:COX15/CtaA family protein [Algisphaera agarilytica]MBB6430870.1 cytochrome c oxidase assembly protein subunit 15 [Algisphaera agarilytica]